jgi:uncharacterized protein (TIGR02246 family)
MTHDDLQRWLDRYIAAWASNDPAEIGDLFTEDAVYSYRPWENDDVTTRGREAIVAAWTSHEEDPTDWDAQYRPFTVEGNRAVAVGWSHYKATESEPEKTFHNVYLLEFDDNGRCLSFHEFWFLER